jgi:hypothetical protein
MRVVLAVATRALAGPAHATETADGIVFDAGSSGSRIHVYSWHIGGGGPKDQFDLIKDDLVKIKPGLSAYKMEPSKAGASLRPLIDHAKEHVPAELFSKTPIFLMATAGLRMVGEAAKDAILASVCAELSASGFMFKCEWATLLDGQDEGLYGWVTVNYLLDRLYPPAAEPPVGIIDLGGGSVQIVFAPPRAAVRSPPEGYFKVLLPLPPSLCTPHAARNSAGARRPRRRCRSAGARTTRTSSRTSGTGWTRRASGCWRSSSRAAAATRRAPPPPPTSLRCGGEWMLGGGCAVVDDDIGPDRHVPRGC